MTSYKTTLSILFSATFLAMMAANDGKAQTANAGANAGAQSSAGSQSGSNSGAAAVINQTTNVPANTTNTSTVRTNNASTGAFSNQNVNSGYTSSDNIVRTTPTVYAPPVSGGNPCTLAVSGGVSVIGWGASAGGTFVDTDCANRQKIAMVHNAGYKLVAKELMCNDQATYNAFKSSGEGPCAFRANFEPQGAAPQPMPTQIAPAVVTPAPMVQAPAKVYPRCDPRRGINDNCAS
jgi:hypothetical protein